MIPFRSVPFSTFFRTFFVFADKSEIENEIEMPNTESGRNRLGSYPDLFRLSCFKLGISRIRKTNHPEFDSHANQPSNSSGPYQPRKLRFPRRPIPLLICHELLISWMGHRDQLVLPVGVSDLFFCIPTMSDMLPIESVRIRIFGYPASSFSLSFPTFPNSISLLYSNVKVKTILGLSRPSSTAFNPTPPKQQMQHVQQHLQ
jgi:hypothetical protein